VPILPDKTKGLQDSSDKLGNFPPKINPKIISILRSHNIKKLYPPQEKALEPVLDNKNVIIAIPTASGKTLIAEIAMIQKILDYKRRNLNKKVLYLCPLKALASEKYHEFQKKWSKLGIKVGYSVGDVDNLNYGVFRNDIIIMTNEKADSLLRNRPKAINDIIFLIVDEIHLLNDQLRGITLEILLTRIKTINPTVQIVGLSATIRNAEEISSWLDGELIKSDWRPVELREGFFLNNRIYYSGGDSKIIKEITKDPTYNLISDVIDEGGQALVFVSTRKSSKSQAEQISIQLKNKFSRKELDDLSKLSNKFKNLANPENMTKETKKLIITMKSGVAFHNAGLSQIQRTFIEDNFRNGLIRVITATPTLAAGVNTPARRVIIKSVFRFNAELNRSVKIPVIEYKQMSGRAGRPGYDPYGDSILVSSNPSKIEELAAYYIFGESEPILSKLNNSGSLQTHILGNIVMEKRTNNKKLIDFLLNTLFAHQLKHGTNNINGLPKFDIDVKTQNIRKDLKHQTSQIKGKKGRKGAKGNDPLSLPDLDTGLTSAADLYDKIIKKGIQSPNDEKKILNNSELRNSIGKITGKALEFLYEKEFIKKTSADDNKNNEEILTPSKFGRVTNRLYIKPYIAADLFRRLKHINELIKENPYNFQINEITFLYIIALTGELMGGYFRRNEDDLVRANVRRCKKNIEMFTFAYDSDENTSLFDDMNILKQLFVLSEWIKETPESNITDEFNIGAGDLFRIVETARWLARAIYQFADLLKNNNELLKITKNFSTRIKYGVKKELVPLVNLKGLGRVKARILYKSGISSIEDMRRIPNVELEKISNLISKSLVVSIKNQINSEKDSNVGNNDDNEPLESFNIVKSAKKSNTIKNKKTSSKKTKKSTRQTYLV
jgi:helicase